MSSQRIAHAHDTFVRTVMSDPRIAREFFTIHLPQDIRELMDFNYLVLQAFYLCFLLFFYFRQQNVL